MTVVRQLAVVAGACFRPSSTRVLIGLSAYAAFLAWLAFHGIDLLGGTAYLYTGLPLAIAGTWIGACVRRTAAWAGSHFTPGLSKALGRVATLAALAALGLHAAVASIGGLEPWPLLVWGPLALAAGMLGGGERPALTSYLILFLAILVPLAPFLQAYASTPLLGWSNATVTVITLAAATVALSRFAFRLHRPTIPSPPATSRWLRLRMAGGNSPSGVWEPSLLRVALWSGVLAASCAMAHRLPQLEWRDGPLIVVVGSVCANITASGSSVALRSGPIPRAAWLLLAGVAKSRLDAARRAIWPIVANSMFAAGVFTAVVVVLGPSWHLVEMMLLAFAACHAYLAFAGRSRWLLSSRLSTLVATPAVVALSAAAWMYGPWGLATALAACLLTAFAAVYVGGLGMARIDLDPVPDARHD
ncbi:MAG: hypothetical protein F4X98_05675 [Gammaproteobacteria bacterium]|nr:hypothetical protein [Gammaproteobacteria bacterium]